MLWLREDAAAHHRNTWFIKVFVTSGLASDHLKQVVFLFFFSAAASKMEDNKDNCVFSCVFVFDYVFLLPWGLVFDIYGRLLIKTTPLLLRKSRRDKANDFTSF